MGLFEPERTNSAPTPGRSPDSRSTFPGKT